MAVTTKPTNVNLNAAIAPAAVAQGLRKTKYIARVTKKVAKGA